VLAEHAEDEEAAQVQCVAGFVGGLVQASRPMPMNATATSPSSPARL
jgi:hypothetical protein